MRSPSFLLVWAESVLSRQQDAAAEVDATRTPDQLRRSFRRVARLGRLGVALCDRLQSVVGVERDAGFMSADAARAVYGAAGDLRCQLAQNTSNAAAHLVACWPLSALRTNEHTHPLAR